MSNADILPAPEIDWPLPKSEWEREYAAFVKMLPDLLQTHEGQYVAVHNQEVVAAGDDEVDVIQQAYKRCGYVTMHVGLVSAEPPPIYRIPSPRVVREGRS